MVTGGLNERAAKDPFCHRENKLIRGHREGLPNYDRVAGVKLQTRRFHLTPGPWK